MRWQRRCRHGARPDRVHDQRHRRAHAGNTSLEEVVMAHEDTPRRSTTAKLGIVTAGDLQDQPYGVSTLNRHSGAAEQGDRRRERLRALVGDPSGRRSQKGAHHLRDHRSGEMWASARARSSLARRAPAGTRCRIGWRSSGYSFRGQERADREGLRAVPGDSGQRKEGRLRRGSGRKIVGGRDKLRAPDL